AMDPAACLASATLPTTDVPSSNRPPAAKVVEVVPTFRWDWPVGERRTRRGGGLRVWLERPWFSSGEDEALAVITLRPDGGHSPEALPFLSAAGRDPVWPTETPPGLLRGDDVDAPIIAAANLPEAGEEVGVRAVPAEFDADRGLWFADLDLGPVAQSSYFPF